MEHITANYHSHTWRCGHARGTEREYVEAAINMGFTVWGFSDHTPIPGMSAQRSAGMRMTMDQLEEYVDTVKALGREYGERIRLHAGLEAEYDPDWFGELSERAKEAGVEYLILGQHFISDGVYSGTPTDDPDRLRDYCRLVMEGMETGLVSMVAHPDLMNFTGDRDIFDAETRKLCSRALELSVPLEMNLLGLASGRHYPNPAFWRVAGETGNEVVLSLDAHAVENITEAAPAEKKALELAGELGLRISGKLRIDRLR